MFQTIFVKYDSVNHNNIDIKSVFDYVNMNETYHRFQKQNVLNNSLQTSDLDLV